MFVCIVIKKKPTRRLEFWTRALLITKGLDLRTLTWDLLRAESSHEIVEIKKMVDLSIALKLKHIAILNNGAII